jgi:riboflavin kinase/FMN adenylyltransferase
MFPGFVVHDESLPMIRSLGEVSDLAGLEGPVNLAVGIFDGVHRGHDAVISAVSEREGTSVVLTFDPHPARVLCREKAPRQITTLGHKQRILGQAGIECLLVVPFNQQRAAQKAEEFVHEIAASCQLGCVAVGVGFRFGKGREGDLALLRNLGSEMEFEVYGIDPVCDCEGEVISSTRVRAALDIGDIDCVSGLLGRHYSLFGVVEEGRRMGREMGFPTANISLQAEQLLPHGVYAVEVDLEGEYLSGVGNLGMRPTINEKDKEVILEVHLFNFDRDIYGRQLEVFFKSRIRDERGFESVDALRVQIGKDVASAQSLLE